MSLSDFINTAQGFLGGASQSQVSSGLAAAFQSNQTPPFPQMLAHLFSNSNGEQRAGILNHLLGAAGPSLGGGLLQQITGSEQSRQVTPEQAQQVDPQTVQQVAQHAQNNDPSVVQRAADFYSQHPQVIQSLGAEALSFITSHARG